MALNLGAKPARHRRPALLPQLLPPVRARRAPVRAWLAGSVIALLVSGLAIHRHHRADREIRAIPAVERRRIYERTLETLRAPCARADARAWPGDALAELCRAQAVFIKRFPECGRACSKLADPFTPRATR